MMEQVKMEIYRQHQLPFGTFKLEHLKNAFTSLVGSADTTALPQFFMWVDMKVAEYKCAAGYVYPGKNIYLYYSLPKLFLIETR